MNVIHNDKLEQILEIGDCVVYANGNSLEIGTILKISPKMVKVARVGSKGYWSRGVLKYPKDLVKLQSEELTLYMLKNA